MILMRFTPALLSGAPDILVEAPITHPFLVKDKGMKINDYNFTEKLAFTYFFAGWCSLSPTSTAAHYGIRCQELAAGDVCLPPNHPDAIRTPDLCDRFKRFEFTTTSEDSPRAIQGTAFAFHPSISNTVASAASHLKGSPPPSATGVNSPAKSKKDKDCDKPKRPMNGFMLFAKKYRLELIQQHPGKDNR